jgi:hypothetical protein
MAAQPPEGLSEMDLSSREISGRDGRQRSASFRVLAAQLLKDVLVDVGHATRLERT